MNDNTQPTQAYCFKCKTKRDMLQPQAVYTKTGSPASKSKCQVCDTTLFRMGRDRGSCAGAQAGEDCQTGAQEQKRSKKAAITRKTARRKNVGKLVIVESPAKARSIGGFLGAGFTVLSSKACARLAQLFACGRCRKRF